jgi:MGT family glycosyltransferase
VNALDSWERCERMLLLGIPDLEPPGTTRPDHLRFVGPCLPLPAEPATGPTPAPAAGDGSPPRVVVSLSSSDMGHERVLQAVLSALGALDVTVVASTAGVVDASRLDLPANVELHDWLPLPEALADAAAAVTHGGHGTVMAALAAGVPLVCVPLGRDQPSTAARLEALGAGRTASPDTVAAAVATTITDEGQRAAALRLRARLAALAGAPGSALDGLARTTT